MKRAFKHIMDKLEVAEAAGELPDRLYLTTYADDAALKCFRPGEFWPGGATEHAREMLSISLAIAYKYPTIDVVLKEIDYAKYGAWLAENGLVDNDGNRAAFVSSEESI